MVASGLGTIFWGQLLMLLAWIEFFGAPFASLGWVLANPVLYVELFGLLLLFGKVLDLFGQVLGLAVPEGPAQSARPMVYGAVLMSLTSLAITAGFVLGPMLGTQLVPGYLFFLSFLLNYAGVILFMFFVRALANEVKSPAWAAMAMTVLVLAVINFILWFAVVFSAYSSVTPEGGQGGVSTGSGGAFLLGGCFLGLVQAIIYMVLLMGLKSKVLDYAGSPAPATTEGGAA
jgi:hypothetical protein